MKRILCFIILLLATLSMTGCKGSVEKHMEKISELRPEIYVGGDGELKVTAISGMKEEPFIIDGKAEGMTDFTLITIVPANYDEKNEYSYEITISDTQYTGVFAAHPFEDSYSALLPLRTFGTVPSVSVICNGTKKSYELVSPVTENYIDADKALDIALKKLSGSLKRFDAAGVGYEIYLRLTENPISNAEGFYWYAAFVGEDGTTYAALIDPETMDIVAIRD